MKVFLSWSGPRGKALAEQWRQFLPNVIQRIKPFVSQWDIEPGTRWESRLASELKDTAFGILCLARDSVHSPWLLFEAGALSKQIEKAYVCPCLLDFSPADLEGPLAAFQAVAADKNGFLKITEAANNALGSDKLPEGQLRLAFERWYADVDQGIEQIKKVDESSRRAPSRSDRELLEEMLGILRSSGQVTRKGVHVSGSGPRAAAAEFIPTYDAALKLQVVADGQVTKIAVRRFDDLTVHLEDFRDRMYDGICADAQGKLENLIQEVSAARADLENGLKRGDHFRNQCWSIVDAILFDVPF